MKYCLAKGCRVVMYLVEATVDRCPSCQETGPDVEPMTQVEFEDLKP